MCEADDEEDRPDDEIAPSQPRLRDQCIEMLELADLGHDHPEWLAAMESNPDASNMFVVASRNRHAQGLTDDPDWRRKVVIENREVLGSMLWTRTGDFQNMLMLLEQLSWLSEEDKASLVRMQELWAAMTSEIGWYKHDREAKEKRDAEHDGDRRGATGQARDADGDDGPSD